MAMNVLTELEATPHPLSTSIGERKLWCEVLKATFYRATIGEQSALFYFSSNQFSTLCTLMGLPEVAIREHVQRHAGTKAKSRQRHITL